jgi:DNA-binding transcriptional regulator YhcF (GntR family)
VYKDRRSDLTISQTDPRPLYLQVKEQIRHRIGVGDWAPGSAIPSIRTLAAAIRVSVITIKRAYLELEREGAIVTRQGKGSSVALRTDLDPGVQRAGLDEQLVAALRVARSLGLTHEEVARRLRELAAQGQHDP